MTESWLGQTQISIVLYRDYRELSNVKINSEKKNLNSKWHVFVDLLEQEK